MGENFEIRAAACVVGESAGDLRVVPARVRVQDGLIVELEESPAHGAGPLDDGLLLTPAFVNGHTHVALNVLRGVVSADAAAGNMVEEVFFRLEEHLQPADVRAFARVGALECAVNGVGVVFDHYYHAVALAEGLRDVGLAAVVAPTLQDLAGPGREASDQALEDTSTLDGAAWRAAGIVPAVGPHATDTVSGALWSRALDLAEALEIPLHAHVAQSAEEWQRVFAREGRGPVGWLEHAGLLEREVPQLLVHALYLDRADLGRLRADRHLLGSCPFSQVQFGFPAPVHEWERAGIPWLVATDCVASNDSMDVQKELRLLAGQASYAVTHGDPLRAMLADATPAHVQRVAQERHERAQANVAATDPSALLSRVWSVPGAWHPRLRTGAIAVGRRADFATWDLHHPSMWPTAGAGASPLRSLAYGDTSPALRGLCVGGRWLGEPNDVRALLRTEAAATMIDEARARRDELLARAGLTG